MRNEKTFEKKINPTEIVYSGEMTLENGNFEIKAKGTITNFFSYTYKLKFEGEIIGDDNYSIRDSFEIPLEEYIVKAGVFNAKVNVYRIHGKKLFGHIAREMTTEIVNLEELHLELVNLVEIGSENVQDGKYRYKGFSSLNIEGWVIEFKKNKDYKKIYEELKEYGGFACTHTVRIYRMDNTQFNYLEVVDILENLYSYLSFICGRRIYPSSYKGVKNGRLVFTRYEPRIIDYWNTVDTWYPKINGEIHPDLFSGFYKIWNETVWKSHKNVLLGTYIECFSQVTLENRITSIQIALEMIARIYIVKYKKDLSNRRFKNLDTKDRIRETCFYMNIPLDEPEQYLRNNTKGYSDPIDFFIKVRNSIVHSKVKIELSHDNIKHAYYIGLWLLELWLLKIFKYKGKYKNRLVHNKWEMAANNSKVPWMT